MSARPAIRGRTAAHALAVVVLTLLAGSGAAAEPNRAPETQPHDRWLADASAADDIALLDLEVPIVLTAATRREQRVENIPQAVSVITADDIRWAGARSVPDALRLVPGVDVADMSYANSPAGIRGFNGFAAREMVVLMDGRQLYDSLTGGMLWGTWPIQLEDIERIEVVRGPGGVTWGANAVNGLINIVTKDPGDQKGLTTVGGGGTQGTFKEHLGYGFADDKLRLRISGEYEASDGFPNGGSLLRRLDDDYKAGRSALHAVYDAGLKDRFTLSAGNAVTDGGFPTTPMAGFGASQNPGSEVSFVLGRWDHEVRENNSFQLTAYVNEAGACIGMKQADYRYQQIAVQFGHTFRPADNHTLTWGVDTRTDLVEAGNADPILLSKDYVSTAILGAYVQDDWRFAPKWLWSLGGRLDYEFYGGFQPSARTSLSYDLSRDSMVYGAISRAFQITPAATRFLRLPSMNGLSYTTGDPNVRPETVMAYEAGYRGRFFDRLQANANVFWQEYDDVAVLRLEPGPPGLMQFRTPNGWALSLYGVELDAKYSVNRSLDLLGHYTFQYMDTHGSTSLLRATELRKPPEHKFMVGVRYSPIEPLRLSAHLYYVDASQARTPANPFAWRHADPYFRLDLRAEYEFWKKQASVAVGVRNLLDPSHYEAGTLFLNEAEVPRMVYAELRLTIR